MNTSVHHPRVFAAQVPGQGRQEGTSRQRGSYEGAQPAPPRGALPHRPVTPSPGTCWLGYAALATVGPPARPGDPLTAGSSLHQGLGAWGQAGAPGTPPPSAPSVLQRKCRQGTGSGGAWKAVAPVPTDARPQPGAGVGELPGRETQAQAETPGDDGGPWGPSRDTGHGRGDQAFIGWARAGAGAQCPAGQQAHRARRSACNRRLSVCKATRGVRAPLGGTQKYKPGGRPAPSFPPRHARSQDS